MAAEGRFADELYLTQFIFEEAKHTEAFRRWFNAIGMTDDLHEHVEFSEPYKEMFMKHLPESLYALTNDPSPANQIRASVTYNHIVEGTLALTGYYAWEKVCRSRGILPGMQQVIKHIGDDERRHMAWGTFTCRRHVAADERNWDVVEERMQELLQPALQFIATLFEQFDEVPFGISLDEMTEYAVDKVSRRLGSIESARGANVLDIDIDASPEALEEKFHVEDEAHIASIMPVAG
jgi:ribonucleoside-diphosphate reductase beta chain